MCRRSSSRLAQRARVSCSSSGLIRKSVAPAFERVVADLAVVDDGDDDDRNIDAVSQAADLLHELDAVEFGQLEIGEDHVHAILPRVLQRPARRVEELQVQLGVDLADDFGDQQPAAEQVVDDEDGIALGSREGELRDHAGSLGRNETARRTWIPFRVMRHAGYDSRHSDKAIVMPLRRIRPRGRRRRWSRSRWRCGPPGVASTSAAAARVGRTA